MASGASRPKAEERKKDSAVAEESGPELFDATQYDFERLEVVVTELVARQRLLQGENTELRQQLEARDAGVQKLEADVENLQMRRSRTHKRLDSLIEELNRLEAAVDDTSPAAGPSSPAPGSDAKREPKRKKARSTR
jgi:predicted nuclease with TOPRIM domain